MGHEWLNTVETTYATNDDDGTKLPRSRSKLPRSKQASARHWAPFVYGLEPPGPRWVS